MAKTRCKVYPVKKSKPAINPPMITEKQMNTDELQRFFRDYAAKSKIEFARLNQETLRL